MIEELSYELNNQRIYGKIYKASEEEKQPIVILSHGLSTDHRIMEPYAERLYEKGINSYVYDFRGGGYNSKSDGKISDMTLDTEKEDLCFVIDSLKEEDFVDEENIYVAGHSQGGLVSSLVAPIRNDIRALFLFAPAYEIPDDMKEKDNPQYYNVLNVMPEYMGDNYINCAIKIDVFEEIKGYTDPVYIFYGMEDKRVPMKYIVKADEVYENSIVYLYEKGEHRFIDIIKDDVVNIISEIIN